MEITILTLFPKIIKPFIKESIIGKALLQKKLKIKIVNFRDFADDKRKTVDDYQIGGGPGMVLKVEPIVLAIEKFRRKDSLVILLTPQGKTFDQKKAIELAKTKNHIILICGHYEGFDERLNEYVDEEISIGNFVITGGEAAAVIITEAISRLIPGVINNNSLENESFENNLLDYPVYTKPNVWRNKSVPQVLLSGNHKLINEYRLSQSIVKTKTKRPDIYKKYIKKGGIKNV